MGIPHLIAQIRPYAKSISWTAEVRGADDKKRDNLIIDGPSLAYYIYHRCLATKTDARTALDAIPTYTELGKATVEWLEKMETFGLYVKQIYFDGHLPNSKTNIRYDRLSKYLLQLKTFRSSTTRLSTSGISYYNIKTTTTKVPLVVTRVPTRLTALPAAPFLVPSVMETLLTSKYGGRTRSVPCEAEVRCTSDDNLEERDIIFTSDSDMILLTQYNRVIFFSDIDTKVHQCDDTLHGEYYDAKIVREKLDCPDLLKLAYLLTIHPYRQIKELAKQARQEPLPPDYDQFRAQFLPEKQHSKFASQIEEHSSLDHMLRRLDPRISEFVQEWGSGLGSPAFPTQLSAPQEESDSNVSCHMFLPFLIDDPVRASAWKPSHTARELAYSILALYGPRFKMMEVDRRGDRIIGTEVPLLAPSAVTETCLTLIQELSQSRTERSKANNWKLMALFQTLSALSNEGVNLPTRDIAQQTCIQAPVPMEWGHVHLSAQIEACLYSLRILCQVLGVYLAADIKHKDVDMAALANLSNTLQQMPCLQEVIDRPGGGLALAESCREDMDKALVLWYGKEGDSTKENDNFGELKRKKKRRKQMKEEVGKNVEASKGNDTNMYNMLQLE